MDPNKNGIVVGTATLFIEKKFLRSSGIAGHIEDVVVRVDYRGQKIGKMLILNLTEAAQNSGCYKVILDCDNEKASFYEKCGFSKKGIQMAKYF